MFQQTLTVILSKNGRSISSMRWYSSESSTSVKKDDSYYTNMGRQQESDDSKPTDWDEALPFDKIPGPKPLPLLGNTWRFLPGGDFYNVKMLDMFKKIREYGNVTIFRGMPNQKNMLFLFDPADMETLFRNEGAWPIRLNTPSQIYYREVLRKDVFKDVTGILTMQGEAWFKFRSIVNPILMQPKIAVQYCSSMDMVANELIENMRYFSSLNNEGEMPEDFMNELSKWALESVSVIALDKHLGCLKRGLPKDSDAQKHIDSITSMFELMFKLDVLPSAWRWFSTSDWKKYVHGLDFMTDFTMKQIDETFKKMNESDSDASKSQMSVFQKLVQIDKTVAVTMVLDMLLAGVDTTSRTLGATLYYLAKNPIKQATLREEAMRLLRKKDSPVTKEVLADCAYTKAVIKETSRLAPVLLGTNRTTVKNIILGGYQIPKGTEVVTANFFTSNIDQHFPQSDEYIPERWLRRNDTELSHKHVNPFVFLPFGFGPRSCVGKRLANLELEVTLLKIFRNFEMTWPHEDMTFKASILYGIADPLKLHVKDVND